MRIWWLVCLFIAMNVQAKQYWNAEEYFELHQGQKELSLSIKARSQMPIDNEIKNKIEGKEISVIAVEPSNQLSDYWTLTQQALQERLVEYGVTVQFEARATSLGEEDIEAKQLLDSIKKRPDFLLMSAGNKREQNLLDLIVSKIPNQKIIVNNLTTPIQGLKQQPFLYAGYDHYEGGYLVGNFYKELGYKKVLGVCLKRGFVADQRLDGFETGFEEYLVDIIHVTGDVNSVLKDKKYIKSKVRQYSPEALFACASDIALTLMDFDVDLPVNGLGGASKEMAAFKAGKLSVVSKRVGNIGTSIADVIALNLAQQLTPKIVMGNWELVYAVE